MNILMFFHASPNPPPLDLGPAKRNFPFLRENIKRHSVTVLSFGSPDEEQTFRELYGAQCKKIIFLDNRRPRIINLIRRLTYLMLGRSSTRVLYTRKMQRALTTMMQEDTFDLVHCSTTLLGFYRFPKGIPLVGDTHNVEYDLMYRAYQETHNMVGKLYHSLEYRFGKREELNNCRTFSAMLATTSRDRDIFLRNIHNVPIHVIQNGVDVSFFAPQNIVPEPRSMVFMGLMNYYPNHHAMIHFLDKILPLILTQVPDSRLFVVGANPSPELLKRATDRIVFTGFVHDVKPWVARGEVFIIPLLIGGGIRGKALEAMALKRPIVSTTLGCEGIKLENDLSAVFADTPQAFADAVVRLFGDEQLRNRLVAEAFSNVQQWYDWGAKGEELNAVYQEVMREGPVELLTYIQES
jgi:polysaccharide biosynthesis protein PslH